MVGIDWVAKDPLHAFDGIAIVENEWVFCGIAREFNFLRHPLGSTREEFDKAAECLRSTKRETEIAYLKLNISVVRYR